MLKLIFEWVKNLTPHPILTQNREVLSSLGMSPSSFPVFSFRKRGTAALVDSQGRVSIKKEKGKEQSDTDALHSFFHEMAHYLMDHFGVGAHHPQEAFLMEIEADRVAEAVLSAKGFLRAAEAARREYEAREEDFCAYYREGKESFLARKLAWKRMERVTRKLVAVDFVLPPN